MAATNQGSTTQTNSSMVHTLPTERLHSPVNYLDDLATRASMFTSKEGQKQAFAYALDKCDDFTKAVASAMIGIYMRRLEAESESLKAYDVAQKLYLYECENFDQKYPKDEYSGISKVLFLFHYMTKYPKQPETPYVDDVIDLDELTPLFMSSEKSDILRSINTLKRLNLIENELLITECGDYIAHSRWTFNDREIWLDHYKTGS
jgi:hypothetical protein